MSLLAVHRSALKSMEWRTFSDGQLGILFEFSNPPNPHLAMQPSFRRAAPVLGDLSEFEPDPTVPGFSVECVDCSPRSERGLLSPNAFADGELDLTDIGLNDYSYLYNHSEPLFYGWPQCPPTFKFELPDTSEFSLGSERPPYSDIDSIDFRGIGRSVEPEKLASAAGSGSFPVLGPQRPSSDMAVRREGDAIYQAQQLVSLPICPKKLRLFPSDRWTKKSYTFGEMVAEHFKQKSNASFRFEHKLWNALQMTIEYPDLYVVVGVKWLNGHVIQVNRVVFGNLLGLRKPTSALFNNQGAFPSHGFVELSLDQVTEQCQVRVLPNESNECRFFVRLDRKFRPDSTEAEVCACRWVQTDTGLR
jgi:hypothetical protein